MVFSDFRPYSAGDDIRYIDWVQLLRLDRLILKLFEEEAICRSICSSTPARACVRRPSKLEYARKIAAALAYVAC